ncbi:MAG: prolipoprotein diacylglyceryl transferase [Myxococcota bacterium]|nr:prolipoprotein diacylglyceryl transferase [Myxococcota bacterium]
MIPEIRIPVLTLWKFEFHAFGILVGIAILVGAYLAAERAARVGLSRQKTNDLVLWLLGIGFLFAHLAAVIFYHPERIREDPWILIQVWNGISSVGGFLGGVVAFYGYTRYHRLLKMAYADAVAYALSFAWIFGRMGCATAHDHKGYLTDFPLAVAFKGGARHDLGLYEMVFAILVAAILFATRHRAAKGAPGLHVGLLAALYGPVRFGLDFLRASDLGGSDLRYFGLTFAQYGSVVIFLAGVAILIWRRNRPTLPELLSATSGGEAPAPAAAPVEGETPAAQ